MARVLARAWVRPCSVAVAVVAVALVAVVVTVAVMVAVTGAPLAS